MSARRKSKRLIDAIESGDVSQARALLANGVDAKAADADGRIPLHWAALHGTAEIAAALLDAGADLNGVDSKGNTPLVIAVAKASVPLVRLFLEREADPNLTPKSGLSPLHLAACGGPRDFGVMTLTSEGGENVLREGREQEDRLPFAPMAEIARLLLLHGAAPDVTGPMGRTPLHEACNLGHAEVAEVLLEWNANTELRDADSRTPLLIAARRGFAEEIRMLLDHGADAGVTDSEGWSPLSIAMTRGAEDSARLIIEKGAPVEAAKPEESPPLHLAVLYGQDRLASLLLDRGADVNSRGEQFRSAMHWAAQEGRMAIGEQLIERGAILDALDKDCATPLGVAVTSDHPDFAALLRRHGAVEETGSAEVLERQITCEGTVWVLRDKSSSIRGYTALHLGEIGDPRAVEPLIRLLGDPEWWPRESAAKALGSLGDPRAAPALLLLLADSERRVRAAAAESLGLLRSAPALASLIDALRDPSDWVRVSVIDALASIGDPRSTEGIAACLEDSCEDVRLHAARALSLWKDPRAVPVLVQSLGADTFASRGYARQALIGLDWIPSSESERIDWAVSGCDWEVAVRSGAAAVRPLLRVVLEAYNEFDTEAEARRAEGARQTLEDVMSRAVAEVDNGTLEELADLGIEVYYPRPAYQDERQTIFETVRLGNSRRIEELAAAELRRRTPDPQPD